MNDSIKEEMDFRVMLLKYILIIELQLFDLLSKLGIELEKNKISFHYYIEILNDKLKNNKIKIKEVFYENHIIVINQLRILNYFRNLLAHNQDIYNINFYDKDNKIFIDKHDNDFIIDKAFNPAYETIDKKNSFLILIYLIFKNLDKSFYIRKKFFADIYILICKNKLIYKKNVNLNFILKKDDTTWFDFLECIKKINYRKTNKNYIKYLKEHYEEALKGKYDYINTRKLFKKFNIKDEKELIYRLGSSGRLENK